MLDAWLDLVVGSRCSACGRPGRALCVRCADLLPATAAPSWPTPTPSGLVPPWSAGEYAEPLSSLVVDHKDHGRLSLARPLGRLLAVAAEAAWTGWADSEWDGGWEGAQGPDRPRLRLVPVPSHPSVVRRRGQDPLLRITREAAARLRRRGAVVDVLPALSVTARPGDQAGLSAGERAENVAGRFRVRPHLTRGGAPVLLVDDVITTGATLREAQRALDEGGLSPFAAATVAATRLKVDPGYLSTQRGTSVWSWSPSGSVVASEGAVRARGSRPLSG